jgi:ATP-dependent helicase HepA
MRLRKNKVATAKPAKNVVATPQCRKLLQRYRELMPNTTRLLVKSFVMLPEGLGIGRLERISEREATVSLFHSVVEQETVRIPAGRLTRAYLYPGTRVYLISEDAEPRVGRVINYEVSGSGYIDYEIQFPNRRTGFFFETELRVRCWRSRGEPTEILAVGVGESQFLHDRRLAATKQLIRARASAQGLTGLISSGIEFVAHQVSAVRRVLSDPLLRYMLADEVGLGKTVEAGIIIRQILIDDPDRYVCVLVPRSLVSQWQNELRAKFYVDDFVGIVEVLAYDEYDELERIPDLLVIDEAHHIVGNELEPSLISHLTELAHRAPRLLLLSATPALANAEKFLSLLNLLDPSAYRKEALEAFKSKLDLRQEFGRLLLGLIPNSSGLVLRRRAVSAKRLFPDDPDVTDLADRLESATRNGNEDITMLTSALSQHIADTYRINQRVIRSRRSDGAGWEFQPRGPVIQEGDRPSFLHVLIDDDDDRRIGDIVSAMEDWRGTAHSKVDSEEARLQAALRYRELVEALGIDVDAFSDAMMSRAILFPGEEEIRAGIRSILASDPGPRCKLNIAEDSLRLLKKQFSADHAVKIVGFCSATSMAQALHKQITRFDRAAACVITFGLSPEQVESILKRFVDSPDIWLLIMDRSGEEGLNLGFADAIAHIDLPLSATRIEQRIGRVDRFGRRKPLIRHRILLPYTGEGSIWSAWMNVLSEGFRVFHEPISDIQFLLDEIDREFALAMFEGGAFDLAAFSRTLREKVLAERETQNEQYALDRLSLIEEKVATFIDTMDDFEEKEDEFGEALESWLVGTLQLSRYRVLPPHRGIFGMAWGERTLVPRVPWESQFGLDNPGPMTWQRRMSVMHPGVVLKRPGSPLLDGCQRFMRWDDRGATFLTLRIDSSWPKESPAWLVFKLCFVIEPNLPETSEIFSNADDMGGLRRAQQFLPPSLHIIYLDVQGMPITDTDHLAMLERPYLKTRDGCQGDLNLGSRPEVLGEFIDPVLLPRLCAQVHKQGNHEILRRGEVVTLLGQAAKRAQEDAERRGRRLLRRANFDGVDIQDELNVNQKIVQAVAQPQIRLDAIGLFIVCGEIPLAGETH